MEKEISKLLKEKLIKQYGEDLTRKILSGYMEKKNASLRVNTLKTSVDEIKKNLIENEIEYKEVKWSKEALILQNVEEEKIRELDIYKDGKIYMQSLSSMIPAIVLEPKTGENILDMAAAPGGKTTQMAALSGNGAMITACEKNKIRFERMKYNLQKQGATRVNALMQDSRRLDDFFKFDKILLDAPCSGSGTDNIFKPNFTKELIEKSAKTEQELIEKAIKILKKDGIIVYSTCSILEEENEEVVEKILKKANAEILEINEIEDIQKLPTRIKGTMCIMPSKLYEGFFIAKIRKIK